jgi:hypothetical protein
MKTKSRKPKRFNIERKRDQIILMLDTNGGWYLKEVDSKILGDFGYHTYYNNYFSVYHVPTGSFIVAFRTEREAKTTIKRFHNALGTGTKEVKEIVQVIKPIVNSLEGIFIEEIADKKEKKKNKDGFGLNNYNPEDDIPF